MINIYLIKSSNLKTALDGKVDKTAYPGTLIAGKNGYITPSSWGFYKNPTTNEKILYVFDQDGQVFGRINFSS